MGHDGFHQSLPSSPLDDQNKLIAAAELDFLIMGHHCGDLGDPAEALCAAGYGIEAFFKLSGGVRASCNVGCGALSNEGDGLQVFEEEGDSREPDWVSPRISFSHDLAVGGVEDATTRHLSEEKGTQQGEGGGGSGEEPDGYSSEFEFLKNGIGDGGFAHVDKGFMLSADELFSEGKLLPLLAQQKTDSVPSCTGHGSKLTLQECHHMQETCKKPIARHLSFDLPKASSPTYKCDLTPLVSLSLDNSPCSSPPRLKPATTTAAMMSTVPALQIGSAKHAFKIKDFFRPKRVNSKSAQLTRDNSMTSTCRIPMPPRSFWPFSRSNSAGESKTTTPPPPTLPPRSNSASESNTGRVSPVCESTSRACDAERCLLKTAHGQDAMASSCEKSTSDILPDTQIEGAISNEVGTISQQVGGCGESTSPRVNPLLDGRRSNASSRGRLAGVSMGRRRYMSTTPNFLRGSPGRRGRFNSPSAKVNAGRIVLKNLERCSAERRLYGESSDRRAVYPIAVRVTPVLNVAVYRGGKLPTKGMFGLASLFSSKKDKAREKSMEAAMNNWRVGA